MIDYTAAKAEFDMERYRRRVHDGPCFVCAMLAGQPDYAHHTVYEDDEFVAFLSRFPTLHGSCLVAPKRHIEDWVHHLDDAEFLSLQSVVHRVARAVAAVVPTERMYALSLGSQQGAPALARRTATTRHPVRAAAVARSHGRERSPRHG